MSPVIRLIHCAACGQPVNPDARCRCGEPHGTTRRRDHKREYAGAQWQRIRAAAIALHPWCADCGSTSDLTGDHVRYPARTTADVVVRCRSCHSIATPKVTPWS